MASGKPRRYSKKYLSGIISSQAPLFLFLITGPGPGISINKKWRRFNDLTEMGKHNLLKVKSNPSVMMNKGRLYIPVICIYSRALLLIFCTYFKSMDFIKLNTT